MNSYQQNLCKHYKNGVCKQGKNCKFLHIDCEKSNCLDYYCQYGHNKETTYLILSNQLLISLEKNLTEFKKIIKKLIISYDRIISESLLKEILKNINKNTKFSRDNFSKYVFTFLIPVNNSLKHDDYEIRKKKIHQYINLLIIKFKLNIDEYLKKKYNNYFNESIDELINTSEKRLKRDEENNKEIEKYILNVESLIFNSVVSPEIFYHSIASPGLKDIFKHSRPPKIRDHKNISGSLSKVLPESSSKPVLSKSIKPSGPLKFDSDLLLNRSHKFYSESVFLQCQPGVNSENLKLLKVL